MELTNALSRVPRALDALEQLTRKEHAGSQRQGRPGGALVDAAAWPSGGQAAAVGGRWRQQERVRKARFAGAPRVGYGCSLLI